MANRIRDVLAPQMERSARIHAATVEPKHVHLLLGPLEEDIERVVGRKGRTSSAAVHQGSEPGRQRTWTAGYWKVFVFEGRAVPIVARYTEAHNERRGLPAAPYGRITPWR